MNKNKNARLRFLLYSVQDKLMQKKQILKNDCQLTSQG